MSSAPPIPVGPLSWEQFLELPDLPDGRRAVALIDGEVVWMAPPTVNHEMVGRNLVFALAAWTGPGLAKGYAITSPLIRVEGRPLGYVADAGYFPPDRVFLDSRGFLANDGLPSVAAEVWSPSNWASEIYRKARDYAKAGVPELWGISPEQRIVTRFADIIDGVYETMCDIPAGGELVTPLLEGFRLDIATLFVP